MGNLLSLNYNITRAVQEHLPCSSYAMIFVGHSWYELCMIAQTLRWSKTSETTEADITASPSNLAAYSDQPGQKGLFVSHLWISFNDPLPISSPRNMLCALWVWVLRLWIALHKARRVDQRNGRRHTWWAWKQIKHHTSSRESTVSISQMPLWIWV